MFTLSLHVRISHTNTRFQFAEERLLQEIEAKRQAEVAIRMHTESVLLWEKRVGKWHESGTVESEMETLLEEARNGQREE
ncbi:hypothetical protein O1611_g9536 [Lasiodiplodia mahajangana]|uniref:Uncharacterized protein n=1 Tax=Lasiodiplodia mahajangana TaxID=1108764 RepID=A0ACC2J8H3_9PEZI|nr:hypothetical protein O1611_g9536 [Lasiodiplodia mahajangana]